MKAKKIQKDCPSFGGLLKATLIPLAFFHGRVVTLKFTCGNCGFKNKQQYDEDKGYAKCKSCKQLNNI